MNDEPAYNGPEINLEKQDLWEKARQFAVAEILAKHYIELSEAQSRHFKRLYYENRQSLDWTCPKCLAGNASYYTECDRCGTPKPSE